jgi:hypothetical protein
MLHYWLVPRFKVYKVYTKNVVSQEVFLLAWLVPPFPP